MTNEIKSGLSGTKTEKNLRDALASEEHSYTKYMIFAECADEDGDALLASAFRDAAGHELSHARLFSDYLGDCGSAVDNLASAAAGEEYDSSVMYPDYAAVAEDEGFAEISDKFRGVGEVEANHMASFNALHRDYSNGDRYEGSDSTAWECGECGYVTIGRDCPDRCPLCSAPRGRIRKTVNN